MVGCWGEKITLYMEKKQAVPHITDKWRDPRPQHEGQQKSGAHPNKEGGREESIT